MQVTVLVLILPCFGAGHALVPSGQKQPAINHPGQFFPACQQVTVPKGSTTTEHGPPSEREHRGAVLSGSSCVLGCLHLTVVHQCSGTSMWPTSWFVSGFCLQGRRSLLHWEPALVMSPSEAFIHLDVQIQRWDARRAVPAWPSQSSSCQNESWMW